MEECLCCESTPKCEWYRGWGGARGAEEGHHLSILRRIGEHRACGGILGSSSEHGLPSYVDVGDTRVLLEGVQVACDEVDGADAMRCDVSHVRGIRRVCEEPPVDLGMQGFDPPAEDFGEASVVSHVDHLHSSIAQHLGRPPCRQNLDSVL